MVDKITSIHKRFTPHLAEDPGFWKGTQLPLSSSISTSHVTDKGFGCIQLDTKLSSAHPSGSSSRIRLIIWWRTRKSLNRSLFFKLWGCGVENATRGHPSLNSKHSSLVVFMSNIHVVNPCIALVHVIIYLLCH